MCVADLWCILYTGLSLFRSRTRRTDGSPRIRRHLVGEGGWGGKKVAGQPVVFSGGEINISDCFPKLRRQAYNLFSLEKHLNVLIVLGHVGLLRGR